MYSTAKNLSLSKKVETLRVSFVFTRILGMRATWIIDGARHENNLDRISSKKGFIRRCFLVHVAQ